MLQITTPVHMLKMWTSVSAHRWTRWLEGGGEEEGRRGGGEGGEEGGEKRRGKGGRGKGGEEEEGDGLQLEKS